MRKENIQVFGLNTLKKIPYNLNKPSFSILLSSNTDWFDMKIDVAFGDQKADLREIQKAILKRQNYVELKDGTLGLLPEEWIEKYKKFFKVGQVKTDRLEISNYQFSVIGI
jgi:non-specific serine/threonine protein kinase